MLDIIKKQIIIVIVCFFISSVLSLFYPVKKELYLGIKNFFHSETILYPNDIITVNYKRTQNNESEFIVSNLNPVLIISINNKYIESIKVDFKDQLKDNLQLRIYIEKENVNDNANNELVKIKDIKSLKEKLSYSAKINDFFKSFVFVIGEQIGDSFVIDSISYNENYKYYWNKIFHYEYLKQLKTKKCWVNILKVFVLFILLIEYFIIRKIIYKKCLK